MLKIAKSMLTIAAVAILAVGATGAYFSDTETSTGNTFSAGTLDLNLDGGNTNVVKFNVANMKPGTQINKGYLLKNVGTVKGYLDIEDIVLTSYENGCEEPEIQAGDVTCDDPGMGQGELQDVVNLRLFVDTNKDGWISTGETVFYNGKFKDLPSNFELNLPLDPGSEVRIGALVDWWSTPYDNLAMGDSMVLDLTFELAQTTGQ